MSTPNFFTRRFLLSHVSQMTHLHITLQLQYACQILFVSSQDSKIHEQVGDSELKVD